MNYADYSYQNRDLLQNAYASEPKNLNQFATTTITPRPSSTMRCITPDRSIIPTTTTAIDQFDSQRGGDVRVVSPLRRHQIKQNQTLQLQQPQSPYTPSSPFKKITGIKRTPTGSFQTAFSKNAAVAAVHATTPTGITMASSTSSNSVSYDNPMNISDTSFTSVLNNQNLTRFNGFSNEQSGLIPSVQPVQSQQQSQFHQKQQLQQQQYAPAVAPQATTTTVNRQARHSSMYTKPVMAAPAYLVKVPVVEQYTPVPPSPTNYQQFTQYSSNHNNNNIISNDIRINFQQHQQQQQHLPKQMNGFGVSAQPAEQQPIISNKPELLRGNPGQGSMVPPGILRRDNSSSSIANATQRIEQNKNEIQQQFNAGVDVYQNKEINWNGQTIRQQSSLSARVPPMHQKAQSTYQPNFTPISSNTNTNYPFSFVPIQQQIQPQSVQQQVINSNFSNPYPFNHVDNSMYVYPASCRPDLSPAPPKPQQQQQQINQIAVRPMRSAQTQMDQASQLQYAHQIANQISNTRRYSNYEQRQNIGEQGGQVVSNNNDSDLISRNLPAVGSHSPTPQGMSTHGKSKSFQTQTQNNRGEQVNQNPKGEQKVVDRIGGSMFQEDFLKNGAFLNYHSKKPIPFPSQIPRDITKRNENPKQNKDNDQQSHQVSCYVLSFRWENE